jgi:hypothetical protein
MVFCILVTALSAASAVVLNHIKREVLSGLGTRVDPAADKPC